MRDLASYITPTRGISPGVKTTDNTPYVSEIADTYDHDSLTFLGLIGANTDADATFTILVEEGDDPALNDNAAVADADLIGTENGASFLFSDDNKVNKIGYKGTKRYVRVTMTPANNGAGDIYFCGVWIKGHPRTLPKTSQLVS